MNWISVKDKLPQSGKRVLFAWTSNRGYPLISIGFHAQKLDVEADFDIWDGAVDCVNDVDYIPEGWYDQSAYEEICYSTFKVTHWMSLPKHPGEWELDDEQNKLLENLVNSFKE
jgi:hypothetical protein